MVGVAQTDRALDCGYSATERKSGVSNSRRAFSKKTKTDLAAYLADYPDLAWLTEHWTDIPEQVREQIITTARTAVNSSGGSTR
jgi:hypothetical protein